MATTAWVCSCGSPSKRQVLIGPAGKWWEKPKSSLGRRAPTPGAGGAPAAPPRKLGGVFIVEFLRDAPGRLLEEPRVISRLGSKYAVARFRDSARSQNRATACSFFPRRDLRWSAGSWSTATHRAARSSALTGDHEPGQTSGQPRGTPPRPPPTPRASTPPTARPSPAAAGQHPEPPRPAHPLHPPPAATSCR